MIYRLSAETIINIAVYCVIFFSTLSAISNALQNDFTSE